jgi:hypothetical protein
MPPPLLIINTLIPAHKSKILTVGAVAAASQRGSVANHNPLEILASPKQEGGLRTAASITDPELASVECKEEPEEIISLEDLAKYEIFRRARERQRKIEFIRSIADFVVGLWNIVITPFLASFGDLIHRNALITLTAMNGISDIALLVCMLPRLVSWWKYKQASARSAATKASHSDDDDASKRRFTANEFWVKARSRAQSLKGSSEPVEPSSSNHKRSHFEAWKLGIEFLSLIPLDYVALACGVNYSRMPLWRLNRVLGAGLNVIYGLYTIDSEKYSIAILDTLRLVKEFFIFILCAHLLACLWFAVGFEDGFLSRSLVSGDVSVTRLYMISFYWAFAATLNSAEDHGVENISLVSASESLVSMFAMLIGAIVFVILVGQVSSSVASLDSISRAHREKRSAINLFCKKKKLPAELRRRMIRHLDFHFQAHGYHSDSMVLSDLSIAIQKDAVLFTCADLVMKVPFFNGCDPGFLYSIILFLHHEFYSPEDVLVWQGEISKGMWFVAAGKLEVIRASSDDGVPDVVVATLSDGTYFGEIALLSQIYGQNDLSSKASATVRSSSFCDLYFLSLDNFEQVLVQYPDIGTCTYACVCVLCL